MKKLFALLMALVLVFGLAACGGSSGGNDTPADPGTPDTPSPSEPEKIKIGFIFLHDENSTYDLNFMRSAKEVCEAEGVEYIQKVGIPEDSECLTAAEELVDAGCNRRPRMDREYSQLPQCFCSHL